MKYSRGYSATMARVRADGRNLTKEEKKEAVREGSHNNTTMNVDWNQAALDKAFIGGDYCLSMHQFKGASRNKEDWLGCDILMFDYDGDEGQPAMDWVVAHMRNWGFYIHYSNSYEVTMTIPKYHIFLRCNNTITDLDIYAKVHNWLRENVFVKSDDRVKDVARACLPGTPRMPSIFEDGEAIDVQEIALLCVKEAMTKQSEELRELRESWEQKQQKLKALGQDSKKAHLCIGLDTMVFYSDGSSKKLRDIEPDGVGSDFLCPECGSDPSRHNKGVHNASYIFNSESYKTPCVFCHSTGIKYEINLTEAYEAGKVKYDNEYANHIYVDNEMLKIVCTPETVVLKQVDKQNEYYNKPEPLAKAIDNSIYTSRNFEKEYLSFSLVTDPKAGTENYWGIDEKDPNHIIGCVAPIAEDLDDPDFVERWLHSLFYTDERVDFIKKFMALYCYDNFREFPCLVLYGARSGGKNTFSEVLGECYYKFGKSMKQGEAFTEGLKGKLITFSENKAINRDLYTDIKLLMGSDEGTINVKYGAKYQKRRNWIFIINSNDDYPFVTNAKEMATSTKKNQFFMHKMRDIDDASLDPDIKTKLLRRMGCYIRKELKAIWDSLDTSNSRYGIDVPITEEYKQIFEMSTTTAEGEVDEFIDWIKAGGIYTAGGREKKLDLRRDAKGNYYLMGQSISEALASLHYSCKAKAIITGMQSRGYLGTSVYRQSGIRLGFPILFDVGSYENVHPSPEIRRAF